MLIFISCTHLYFENLCSECNIICIRRHSTQNIKRHTVLSGRTNQDLRWSINAERIVQINVPKLIKRINTQTHSYSFQQSRNSLPRQFRSVQHWLSMSCLLVLLVGWLVDRTSLYFGNFQVFPLKDHFSSSFCSMLVHFCSSSDLFVPLFFSFICRISLCWCFLRVHLRNAN